MSSKVEVDGDYVIADPVQKNTDSDYALAQQIELLKSTHQRHRCYNVHLNEAGPDKKS